MIRRLMLCLANRCPGPGADCSASLYQWHAMRSTGTERYIADYGFDRFVYYYRN